MKKPQVLDVKSKAKRPLVKKTADKAIAAEGEAAPRRADRAGYKRGGAVKKGSTVNIVIAPQGGAAGPGAAPGPGPMPISMPPPRPMPMPGPAPGAGPMVGPPRALPPQGLGAPPPPGAFKRGGPVMAGSGTGVARLQAQNRGH